MSNLADSERTICGGETTHVAEQKVIKAYAL
jgi:hypothetical protein